MSAMRQEQLTMLLSIFGQLQSPSPQRPLSDEDARLVDEVNRLMDARVEEDFESHDMSRKLQYKAMENLMGDLMSTIAGPPEHRDAQIMMLANRLVDGQAQRDLNHHKMARKDQYAYLKTLVGRLWTASADYDRNMNLAEHLMEVDGQSQCDVRRDIAMQQDRDDMLATLLERFTSDGRGTVHSVREQEPPALSSEQARIISEGEALIEARDDRTVRFAREQWPQSEAEAVFERLMANEVKRQAAIDEARWKDRAEREERQYKHQQDVRKHQYHIMKHRLSMMGIFGRASLSTPARPVAINDQYGKDEQEEGNDENETEHGV